MCPVLFFKEDLKRHEKEFQDIVYVEAFLDVQIGNVMEKRGHRINIGGDGSVSLDDFDTAKKAEELLASVSKDENQEQDKALLAHARR